MSIGEWLVAVWLFGVALYLVRQFRRGDLDPTPYATEWDGEQ